MDEKEKKITFSTEFAQFRELQASRMLGCSISKINNNVPLFYNLPRAYQSSLLFSYLLGGFP